MFTTTIRFARPDSVLEVVHEGPYAMYGTALDVIHASISGGPQVAFVAFDREAVLRTRDAHGDRLMRDAFAEGLRQGGIDKPPPLASQFEDTEAARLRRSIERFLAKASGASSDKPAMAEALRVLQQAIG